MTVAFVGEAAGRGQSSASTTQGPQESPGMGSGGNEGHPRGQAFLGQQGQADQVGHGARARARQLPAQGTSPPGLCKGPVPPLPPPSPPHHGIRCRGWGQRRKSRQGGGTGPSSLLACRPGGLAVPQLRPPTNHTLYSSRASQHRLLFTDKETKAQRTPWTCPLERDTRRHSNHAQSQLSGRPFRRHTP